MALAFCGYMLPDAALAKTGYLIDMFDELGSTVGILVYFAEGFNVGRCKIGNKEAVIEVGLEAIETMFSSFDLQGSISP